MSKHTPGPWMVGETLRAESLAVIGDGDSVVCEFPGRLGADVDADARLIAAAPELLGQHEADMVDLDLLAKAIHAGDPMPELVIRVTDMLNRKRAAIAKATGEQT